MDRVQHTSAVKHEQLILYFCNSVSRKGLDRGDQIVGVLIGISIVLHQGSFHDFFPLYFVK